MSNLSKLISRSQFREDLEVVRIFGRDYKGRFLEVGGNDGVSGSTTYLLETLGWSGLIVEPNPCLAALCRERRPGSVVVAMAAVGDPSIRSTVLFEAADGSQGERLDGMSSIVAPHHERCGTTLAAETTKPREVPAATLDAMLQRNGLSGRFDFVSIDVEGAELDVLRGFSLTSAAPSILLIEDNTFGAEPVVNEYLARFGYRRVCRSFVNDWYVPAESAIVVKPIRYTLIEYLEFKNLSVTLGFTRLGGYYPSMREMIKAEGATFWPLKYAVFRIMPARLFYRILVFAVALKARFRSARATT